MMNKPRKISAKVSILLTGGRLKDFRMSKKFNIPESQKVIIERATLKMSSGLINYLFTEVLMGLTKRNLKYGAAMHYIEERLTHLSNKELMAMWASYEDKRCTPRFFRSLWLLARDLHSGKTSQEEVFEWVNSTHHIFSIFDLQKKVK